MITIDRPSDVTEQTLAALRQAGKSKRLFLKTSNVRLDQKTRDDIANLGNVVFISNYDCSNSIHSAADLASTKSSFASGIALVDRPISSQDPSACLFEIVHRFSPSVVMIGESLTRGTVDERLSRTCKSFEALPADSLVEIASQNAGDGTCRVSQAVIEDRILVSLSNLAPWDSIVKLESIDGSRIELIAKLVTGH